jgi:hypothetical protein
MGAIEELVRPDSKLGIRERIFQFMCLIASFFAIVIVTPTNILERLPYALTVGIFCFGAAFFAMYWLARKRGIYTYKLSSLLALALLDFSWFLDGGSQGPVALILFSATMFYTVLFSGLTRWVFLSGYGINILALYYAESRFPSLVAPYISRNLRLQDIALTVPAAVAMCALMMTAVLGAYDAERTRLARSQDELKSRLSEIRTLRGLLPICAGCKKIRTSDGEWVQMERYIVQHSDAEFSHGLCPQCMAIYLPTPTEQ